MRFKIFGVDRAINSKLKLVQDAIKDPELLNRVGRLGVAHIQRRTRDGLDVNRRPIKPLAPSTIRNRKYLEKFNRTSAYYESGTSNLHFTGQLIRAISYVIEGAKVFVRVSGARKPYRTGKGPVKRTPTNAQLAEYQAEKGREFLGSDEILQQSIREAVVRAIRRLLRR